MFWLSSYKSWMKASLDNCTRLVGPIPFWRLVFDRLEHLFRKCQDYYNIFGQEAGQPVWLPSVSCLSYNKRDNWLTRQDLGVRVR